MFEWLPIGLALALSGVTLTSTGLWVHSVGRLRTVRNRLAHESTERESLVREISTLREAQTGSLVRLDIFEKEHRDLEEQGKTTARRLQTARAELKALEAELSDARQSKEDLEQRTRALLRKHEAQKSELSEVRAEARKAAQLLDSMGLALPSVHHEPFAVERRPFTRAAIQELLVDCAGFAAALVNDDGLVGIAAGHDAAVARLGPVASWGSLAEAELSEVLCAPVTSWSVMDGRFCNHFVRVDGTPWWIGIENDGVAPLSALRRAHVRIVELPAPASPVPVSANTVLDLDHAPDAALGRKLTEWAARWGADAVTVLDVEGRPLGATASAQPSSVMAVRRALTPVFQRLVRDGRFLDDTTLVARATGESVLTLRMVGEDLEAPMLAVVGPTEVPERAVDELCGVLRWHLSARPSESREAS